MGRVGLAEMVDPHCAHISKGEGGQQAARTRRKACTATVATCGLLYSAQSTIC